MRHRPAPTKRSARPAPKRPGSREADRDLLHGVLDSLPQGVVMFSAEGRLLFANRQFLDTYGFSADDFQPGLSFGDILTLRLSKGTQTAETIESARKYTAHLMDCMKRGETLSGYHQALDGRAIHYINTPLPSGGWIVTHEDVTQQRDAEKQIEHMASHDALTDLPNRVSFGEALEHALRFNPRGKLLAVLFLDLDNFKGINDTLGHQVGDELLKTVAERLRSCLRGTDMIARFGGDEFVVASTALDTPAEAALLAIRIRDAILQPFDLLDHQVVVDTSVGIAIAPTDGTTAEQLLKSADLALYSAKGSGRGTYRFFEAEMDIRMMERRNLELDLRAAFVNGEFEIHYQPLLNLERNSVSCCEALLRWTHATRGSVSPVVFIPIAEEIGLIARIGEWVIRNACAEAAQWPEDVSVAVNVSPAQFRSQNLVQIVAHALASTGLTPRRLEIEITEAILLEQTEETLATLRRLHHLGVRIAMDDFGTGYSSLSYLQKFPFDKIKIDQAFIGNLQEGGESNAIVRAVTNIAGSFHMETTAEGVETQDQRAMVEELGCTEMQGHLFSEARSAAEIRKLLCQGRRSEAA